ncbi:MAG TPA: AmmeMemoRadiSam system protein B [Clostridiaceae bacterium]|nr:AmmeMemoRadiSam system protein B [Clostridiaceae bacterium]
MKKPLLAVALVLVACITVALFHDGGTENSAENAVENTIKSAQLEQRARQIHSENLKCINYIDKDFKLSVNTAVEKHVEQIGDGAIKGGIIPHHLLAGKIIASFFKTVASINPDIELVVVIAPNHKRLGNTKIHTGSWGWETPYGILDADGELVKQIENECGAGSNFKLLEEEHSVSSLVPYIKYFLPESKILPILLHGDLGLENSVTLGEKIESIVEGKNYIIIASIDFSHYLPVEKADKMDEITLEAIKTRNLATLSRMGNDNLDSPPSIIALLKAMDKEGADSMAVLDHSNSARITGTGGSNTTSYFSIVFFE